MITQSQGFSITSLDELAVTPAQFDDFMTEASACLHPIGAMYTATVRIVRQAFWLGELKETLSKKDFNEVVAAFDWKDEVKRYLKISKAFKGFTPHQLAQIEPRTIFQIAENLKKYQSVITQMSTLAQITQEKVRDLIKLCYEPRAKKKEEVPSEFSEKPLPEPTPSSNSPSIWRWAPDGKRVCQIGPIYNESVGVMLEKMIEQEGLTPQAIVEEALLSRYISKYECPQENSEASYNTTEVETIELASETYKSWDDSFVSVEELIDETSLCNPWNDEEDDTEDAWSFEPEEKDDFIEDYELVASAVNTQTKMAPVEKLIETFQTASSWQEIREAIETHQEYKQVAWDALTPVERRRVIEITPPVITKLNNAKRKGLIMDFRELRQGVYQVQLNGCLFWEIVYESRIEEFFTRL